MIDRESEGKGRKLSREAYSHRRSCRVQPQTHIHAATEHANTHALTHSIRHTSTQRPIDAHTHIVHNPPSWWKHGNRLDPGGVVQ